MAITVGDLVVQIGADISRLGDALKDAEGQLQGFAANTEASGVALTRLSLAAGAAGAAILGALGIATKAASESRIEQELLANAIRASGKAIDQAAIERLANQLQRVTGVSDETTSSIARQLVQFGATQEQVEKLVPRILDMAAAGKGLESSTFAVGKAITGQDTALKRLLGNMAKGIDVQADLNGATRILDRAYGGMARTVGENLPGALDRLRESFDNLLEVIGGPILRPITLLVIALSKVVDAFTFLAQKAPIVVVALVAITAAIGALMVGGAGLLALRAVIPIIDKALLSLAGSGLLKSALAARLLGTELGTVAIAMRALRLAGIVGLVATVAQLGFEFGKLLNKLEVVRQASAGVLFPFLLLNEVLQGRTEGAVARVTEALEKMVRTEGRLSDANKNLVSSNQDVVKSFEEILAAAEVAALEAQRAATERARIQLEQPDLSKEDLVAIEEQRQEGVNKALRKKLEERIRITEAEIAKLDRTNAAHADRLLGLDKQLITDQKELADLRFQNEREAAERLVEVHEQLVDQRRRLDVQAAQLAADAVRESAEIQKTIQSELATAEEQARQRRLELFRAEQSLRISLLERVVQIERELGEAVLSARESLLRATNNRLQVEAIRNAKLRADEVKRGVLTEAQAQQLAEIEKQQLLERTFAEELKIEQKRLDNQLQNIRIETALAQQKAASRLKVLDLETKATKQSLDSQHRLKIIDLEATKKITQAELTAKLVQLRAEFEATKSKLALELKAKEQAGLLTAEERRDRVSLINETQKEFDRAAGAFGQAAAAKIDAADQSIAIARKSFADQMTAIDQKAALDREQIQTDLTQTLIGLASKDLTVRAAATDRLSALQLRASQEGMDDIADQIGNILKDQQAGAEQQMGDLATVYETFSKRVLIALQPVKDMVDSLLNPLAANAALAKLIGAFAFGGAAPVPAGAEAADVDQTFNFNFSGVDMNLSADETRLLERVIVRLLGPDGRRLFDDYVSRQPKG